MVAFKELMQLTPQFRQRKSLTVDGSHLPDQMKNCEYELLIPAAWAFNRKQSHS